MTILTIGRFLIGDRQAIIAIAHARGGLGIAALLVLSAALARTYDTEPLRAEPWHVAIPFGVSFGAALILFVMFYGMAKCKGFTDAGPIRSFTVFLTLFWMTAPLAWLYGIPYERFLSAGEAVSANLWMLAIVSAWRVLLITRVIQVMLGVSGRSVFGLVMLFADASAVLALTFIETPIISVMGGVNLSVAENAVASATMLVAFFGVISAPVWLIWCFAGVTNWRPPWQPLPIGADPTPARWSTIGFACLCIVVATAPLPWTQPEQNRRHEATLLFAQGRFPDTLMFMSRFQADEFPPHWDPPPRPAYGERVPPLIDLLEMTADADIAPWVRRIYADKFIASHAGWYWLPYEENLSRLTRVLSSLPDGAHIAQGIASRLETLHLAQSDETPEQERADLARLLDLAGVSVSHENDSNPP